MKNRTRKTSLLSKGFHYLLVFSLLFLAFPVSNVEAAGSSTVNISNYSGEVGSSVTVTININTNQQMSGGQLDLVYDSSKVLLNSVNAGSFISGLTVTVGDIVPDAGSITLTWLDITFENPSDAGSGELFQATFNLVAKGNAAIQVQNLQIGDENGDPMITSINNGSIDVSVSAASALAAINGTDEAGMKTALETYSTELSLAMTDYNALDASYQDAVAASVFGGKPTGGYTSTSAVATAFNTAVAEQENQMAIDDAIAAVNAATAGTMASVLSANNDVLGLNLAGDYADLNDKSPVHQALVTPVFTEISQIVSAFNNAVAAQLASENEEAAIAAATAKVVVAEGLVDPTADLSTQDLIDAAQTAYDIAAASVSALPNSPSKTDLTARLATVQTDIDDAQLALDLATATAEVVAAESALASLGTQILIDAAQADHDSAKALVTALPDSLEKTNLTGRLSSIQTAINTAQDKLDAINDAITAISDIPSNSEAAGHLAATIAARAKVEAAINAGASTNDITNYDDLLAAEAVYYKGYLVGTLNRPMGVESGLVKVKINGTTVGQKTVDFSGGNVVLAYGDFPIAEISTTSQAVIEITIPGYVAHITLPNPIDVKDLQRGGGTGSDILDLSASDITFLAGDANNDGIINLLDVATLAQSFNQSTTDRSLDFTSDGVINVKDLYYIGINFNSIEQ